MLETQYSVVLTCNAEVLRLERPGNEKSTTHDYQRRAMFYSYVHQPGRICGDMQSVHVMPSRP